MDTREELLFTLLKAAMEGPNKPETFTTRQDATKELEDFVEAKQSKPLKPGDLIERNAMGMKRYTLPNSTQAARVVRFLDAPVFNEQSNDMEDMLIVVALAKGYYRYYQVNSAYYQPSSTKSTYVFNAPKETGAFDA